MAGGQDIAFVDVGNNCLDLKIVDGDLQSDDGLENAVLISIFTDKRVEKEELPESIIDQKGWWADSISDPSDDLIGSKFWLQDRGKLTTNIKNDIRDDIQESLQWLIDDGIAATVEVTTTLIAGERIDIDIQIFKPEGDDHPFKFVWDGQELKAG